MTKGYVEKTAKAMIPVVCYVRMDSDGKAQPELVYQEDTEKTTVTCNSFDSRSMVCIGCEAKNAVIPNK